MSDTDAILAQRPLPGLLLIVSAASGTGKTTLCRRLVAEYGDAKFSVSTTTRPKSEQEQEGIDYYFVDEDEFIRQRDAGEFAEFARVHGHHYGTSKQTIRDALSAGKVLVLEIDVQGAALLKAAYPGAVSVFVLPPGMEELERRIRTRGRDEEAVIGKRMKNARAEMRRVGNFDYLLINERLDEAFARLLGIVHSERLRGSRVKEWIDRFVDSL